MAGPELTTASRRALAPATGPPRGSAERLRKLPVNLLLYLLIRLRRHTEDLSIGKRNDFMTPHVPQEPNPRFQTEEHVQSSDACRVPQTWLTLTLLVLLACSASAQQRPLQHLLDPSPCRSSQGESRPRKTLGFEIPASRLQASVASTP